MRIERVNLKDRGRYIQPCDDVMLGGHWFHVMATTPRVIIVVTLAEYQAEHPDYESAVIAQTALK